MGKNVGIPMGYYLCATNQPNIRDQGWSHTIGLLLRGQRKMMWDSPLYAVNMIYYPQLLKKLFGPVA